MTIIIFILILGLLIFVHELGHFLAAKAVGARVDEFALGFPPTLFSYQFGETKYSLNLLPIGGFVKIYGEDPLTVEPDEDYSQSLVAKPKWQQAIVLSAGVTFNVILAWLLISVGLIIGLPASEQEVGPLNNSQLTIVSVLADSPAEKAGLMAGDVILEVSNSETTIETPTISDFQLAVMKTPIEEEVSLTYQRQNKAETISLVPKEGLTEDKTTMLLGVALDQVGYLKLNPIKAFIYGVPYTFSLLEKMIYGFGDLFVTVFSGEQELKNTLAGPIGIASLVGEARDLGFVYLLTFTAFISLNLAIINLIPFPALDGGRLLFLVIEKIKGSPLNPRIASTLNLIGLLFLLGLMILISVFDVMRLW